MQNSIFTLLQRILKQLLAVMSVCNGVILQGSTESMDEESFHMAQYAKQVQKDTIPKYKRSYYLEHLLVDHISRKGNYPEKFKYELRIRILKTYFSDFLNYRVNSHIVNNVTRNCKRAQAHLHKMLKHIQHRLSIRVNKGRSKRKRVKVFLYQARNVVCSFFRKEHNIHLITDQ